MPDDPILSGLRNARGIGPDVRVLRGEMPLSPGAIASVAKSLIHLPELIKQSKPAAALIQLLNKPLPAKDPLKVFQAERIGRTLPAPEPVKIPQGFQGPPSAPPRASNPQDASLIEQGYWDTGRSPMNAYRYSQQQKEMARYNRPGPRKGSGPRASNPGAKLDLDQVKKIRAEAATKSLAQLAKEYGVKETTVGALLRGDTWSWVK